MEKIFTKALGLVLITAMLLSMIPAFATEPPQADAIWIEPSAGINLSTASVTIGYQFSIMLWAKSSVTCGAWQIRLAYNFSYLQWLNASFTGPGGAKSDFFSNISTVPGAASHANLNATCNKVDMGESWAGSGPQRDPGSGSLAEFWFNVTAVPVKGGNINSWFDIHSFDPAHSGTPKTYFLPGYYGIGVDAPYTFVWNPPPGAYLISAIDRFYDRTDDRVGTIFHETVKVHVDSAWYMTQCNFTMSYDDAFLQVNVVTLDTTWWNVAATYDNSTAGQIVFNMSTGLAIGGDVMIASDVEFEVIYQGTAPENNTCYLSFSDVRMWDHVQQITHGTDQKAFIVVEGILLAPAPWLEVIPNLTIFELPPVGTMFSVDVTVQNLYDVWKLVGMEFRLKYDDTWLAVVPPVVEGPYLGDYAPYGTWFVAFPNEADKHVLVGTLILPNGSGQWNPPFPGLPYPGPGGSGTIATITFMIIQDIMDIAPTPDIVLNLGLFGVKMIRSNGKFIPPDPSVNGTVIIRDHYTTGRFLDIYGGACDAGYGPAPEPWPAPYGGQGLNKWMEIVIPQSCVCIYGTVTYNGWPVQMKDVSIEVEGPYLHVDGQFIETPGVPHVILLKLSARTNATGQFKICFTMPWPCDDPEDLLGVWIVTGTVNIVDVVVVDHLYYYYDYMVHIWKVTTDKYYYKHCEDVVVTIEYGSHAMLHYPGLAAVVIMDELGVPFMGLAPIDIGGIPYAGWSVYVNGTVVIRIHVMKWWFVGYADIFVNIYDKDPTIGGFNWFKQVELLDAIYILPEWA
jgi:hypothetical protein